jgi:hypothetical protein
MFRFQFDPFRQILRVHVHRSWTSEGVARYAREAGVQFEMARQKAGRLRLLLNLSGSPLIRQELIAPLVKAGTQFSRSDDRVALVVDSMLRKMQMKRIIKDAPTPIFVEESAAVDWLASDAPMTVAEALAVRRR